MTWLMPPEMLPVAALLGLIMVWPRLRAPTTSWRLFGEVFASAVASQAPLQTSRDVFNTLAPLS